MRNVQIVEIMAEKTFVDMIQLPLARRGVMEETVVGFPDLRILVLLRLLMNISSQWLIAESLPAYSGGTVLDLHQLPRHNREYSSKQPSFFEK